jgi:hypothetical protein
LRYAHHGNFSIIYSKGIAIARQTEINAAACLYATLGKKARVSHAGEANFVELNGDR